MQFLASLASLLKELILGRRSRIVVSYSSQDQSLVQPVVRLLRVTQDLVFFAPDSIPLGEKWWNTIQRAIRRCELILVFWCYHSSQSKEVEREFTYAQDMGKEIIPVFLDDTTVPDLLKQYQGLDFRLFSAHTKPRNLKPLPPGPLYVIQNAQKSFSAATYWKNEIGQSRSALKISVGVALAFLAFVRPFPALIESELITILNWVILAFGLLLTLSTLWRFMTAERSLVHLSESEQEFAQRLSLMIREILYSECRFWNRVG